MVGNLAASELTDADKQRARQQWTEHPCGTHVAAGLEVGARRYFDAIEHARYNIYSPWMRETIGFDSFADKRLLEIGFGTGTDLLQFARGGAAVTGVDLTPRSIEIGRARFEIYGERGEFLIGDAENLGFPDASFDVVYSFGVLHHTPNTELAIAEIHRVLRPGGRAIVMLYHRSSLFYWGGLIFKRGILQGDLFRYSVAEMMSRYVEYPPTGEGPLVKAYSRAEARRLFRGFANCQVTVNQLTQRELRPFGRLLPAAIFDRLERSFGWNLIIKADK